MRLLIYIEGKVPTRIQCKHAGTDTGPNKINCSWYYVVSLVVHKSFSDLDMKVHHAAVIMLWCYSDCTLTAQICYHNILDMGMKNERYGVSLYEI